MADRVTWWLNLLGQWGRPGDGVAWVALAGGTILFLLAWQKRAHLIFGGTEKNFLFYSACGAAFLSLGYVAFYLRGAPRIVDAGAYFFQARALAGGHFSMPLGDVAPPSASFRGRFLLYDEHAQTLTGIFPPGYPLVLSLGMRLGVPMIVGPVLAAALVYATARLANEWLHHTTIPKPNYAAIVRVAVLANVLCATLRYHTADTMSHGLAALLVTIALAESLRGKRQTSRAAFAIAGLAIGALAATRLASAPPILILAIVIAFSRQSSAPPPHPQALPLPLSLLLPLLLALVPGLFLLAESNTAATGSFFMSTQRLYYATSDGPPGCFRYGFGHGVGCLYEHGDFVRARMPDSYGVVAACGTTLRRLRAFLTDVQNVELLAIVPFFSLGLKQARWATRIAFGLVALFVLAYAPFYFDGNYPGGGARLFADVLPTAHVLFAAGAYAIAIRLKSRATFFQIAAVLLGAGLVGFAVHASFDHRALRDRDGGAPLFDEEMVKEAQIKNGILFVDTDLGFLIGHGSESNPKNSVVVARHRGDAHDRVLFEHLGKPASFTIERTPAKTRIVSYTPPIGPGNSFRFELESEWPPISQDGGYAIPAWVSGTCASQGQVLRITPASDVENGIAHVRIALPVPAQKTMIVAPRMLGTGAHGRATITIEEAPSVSWVFDDIDHACKELAPTPVLLPETKGHELHVLVTVERAPVDFDEITLRP